MLTAASAALLATMAERPLPPLEELTPDFYRSMLASMPKVLDPTVTGVSVSDLDDAPRPVRVYRPASTSGPCPALIFYHGGGYVACSLETHDNLCRKLAADSGVVLFSVDYRLAPEHRFPVAVDDCYAMAKWIIEKSEDLDIDRGRVAVGGDSAGGALAIVTALRFRDEGSPAGLVHQLLFYPSTDLDADNPSRRVFAAGFGLDRALADWFESHYIPSSEDRADWRLSPARASSLAGLPPATIVTAECDPLRDEAETFAELLKKAGVEAHVRRFGGVIHGFVSMYQLEPEGRRAIEFAAERLGTALAA